MARRRKPGPWLFLCVLGSLSLHLLLLTVGGTYTELHAGARAGGASLRIRSIVAEAVPVATPQAAATEAAGVTVVVPAGLAMPAAHAREEVAPPAQSETETRMAPGDSAPTPEPDDGLYLPRRMLEQPPRLMSQVLLPWPEEGPPNGHYSEIVSLFIDEDGSVRRVRVEGPGLPRMLQDIAQDAFLQARFSPGLLDGRPVKAWIRLEVRFDAEARVAPRGVRR